MLCPRNAHRIYLTGVLLAAKLMDDNVFNNPYWAKVMLPAAQAVIPATSVQSPHKMPASLAILPHMNRLLLRYSRNQVTLPSPKHLVESRAQPNGLTKGLSCRLGGYPRESCMSWSSLRCSSSSTGCASPRTRWPRA